MRIFNWAEAFKETPTCDDILNKVQKMERIYWIWFLISIFLTLWGVGLIAIAPANDLKSHCFGLFLAIDGCISVAVIKIWAHIRLTMYFIIWDRNNRIEAEMKSLEAQDL